jgi:hypothetical protein
MVMSAPRILRTHDELVAPPLSLTGHVLTLNGLSFKLWTKLVTKRNQHLTPRLDLISRMK